MTDHYPDEAQRRALCDTPVTLDGEPAHIAGIQLPFPKVISRSGCEVEFAWKTVQHIVAEKGGAFES